MIISDNIIIFIGIITGIIGVTYFFYDAKESHRSVPLIKKINLDTSPEKKVRFDDKIKCVYYDNKHPSKKKMRKVKKNNGAKSNTNSPKYQADLAASNFPSASTSYNPIEERHHGYKISQTEAKPYDTSDYDGVEFHKEAFTSIDDSFMKREDVHVPIMGEFAKNPRGHFDHVSESRSDLSAQTRPDVRSAKSFPHFTSEDIIPSNLDLSTMGDSWDSSFGIPLMSKQEQSDYVARMINNHKKFNGAVTQFFDYVTDQKAVLKTDVSIDPFSPANGANKLRGKTVGEIYDEQVAGPQAVPMKIKSVGPMETIYENENPMNGGDFPGTHLKAFDSHAAMCKQATFGNEF